MKIGGKKLSSKPASDMIVFPREDGDIAIRANAIMDRTQFDNLCPIPKPPQKMVKGGIKVDDPDNPKYKILLNQHSAKFINWMTINSLCTVNKETHEDEPLEWETVDRLDPTTWAKWEDELKDSGFSDMDRKRIQNLVFGVNSISDARLDEARNSFLQHQGREQDQLSSQNTEQADMPSGEPASDSESDLLESRSPGTISMKRTGG